MRNARTGLQLEVVDHPDPEGARIAGRTRRTHTRSPPSARRCPTAARLIKPNAASSAASPTARPSRPDDASRELRGGSQRSPADARRAAVDPLLKACCSATGNRRLGRRRSRTHVVLGIVQPRVLVVRGLPPVSGDSESKISINPVAARRRQAREDGEPRSVP